MFPDALNPFELGYTSAALDGEGFIALNSSYRDSNRRYFTVHIGFVNTDLDWLKHIQSMLGIGKLSIKPREYMHHRQTYVLRIVKQKEALWLLQTIYSFLIIKREKANLIIEFLESRIACNPNAKANCQRQYSKKELLIFDRYRELRSYKSTGARNAV